MADYYGLDAIGARLGVTRQTVAEWKDTHGFLMYPRRQGFRTIWYTNDQLILAWEKARALAAPRLRFPRKAHGKGGRKSFKPLNGSHGAQIDAHDANSSTCEAQAASNFR